MENFTKKSLFITKSSAINTGTAKKAFVLLSILCCSVFAGFAQLTSYTAAPSNGTYTVPAGCTSVKITVAGAAGGVGLATAGSGGTAVATFTVTPLQSLYYYVGSAGSSGPGTGGSSSGGGEDGGES